MQKNPLKSQFFVVFFIFFKNSAQLQNFATKKGTGTDRKIIYTCMVYVVINMGRGPNGGMGVDRIK